MGILTPPCVRLVLHVVLVQHFAGGGFAPVRLSTQVRVLVCLALLFCMGERWVRSKFVCAFGPAWVPYERAQVYERCVKRA